MTDIVVVGWEFALRLARSGDTSLLATMLRANRDLPDFVRETLVEIAEGKARLAPKRGTKSRSDYLRASDMASLVDHLQRTCGLREKTAVAIVGDRFGLSPSRVRAVVREHRSTIPRPRVAE